MLTNKYEFVVFGYGNVNSYSYMKSYQLYQLYIQTSITDHKATHECIYYQITVINKKKYSTSIRYVIKLHVISFFFFKHIILN